MDRDATGKTFVFVTWPTVVGPQTERIPYTKQSQASWEHWLGESLAVDFLRISRPQHTYIIELSNNAWNVDVNKPARKMNKYTKVDWG